MNVTPASPGANVYTVPARLAHWATAALLAVLFGLGLSMTRWIEGDAKFSAYLWHESIGLTVFALSAFRLLWRFGHPPPPFPLPWFERVGAQTVHALIYIVLVCQPIVGWMLTGSFGFTVNYLGLFELPGLVESDRELALTLQSLHARLALALAVLFGLHLCGVLYHHLGKRDGLLRRMLPGSYDPSTRAS
jgi:cytochrome b561